MFWQHGEKAVKEFIDKINSCHSSIKFTADYSRHEINFLDVNVILEGGKIK